jgi:hypothetical protein
LVITVVISNIPLSPYLPVDMLVWRGTSTGLFSVRSAYHLGKELQNRSVGECSISYSSIETWKAIWSINVPNPAKVFLWKAWNNILPSRVNLFKRRVVDDP